MRKPAVQTRAAGADPNFADAGGAPPRFNLAQVDITGQPLRALRNKSQERGSGLLRWLAP